MLKTIILCRHGEVHNPQNVFYGRSINVPLSDEGKKQIENVGQHINKLNLSVEAIYTSPLLRTVQTSQVLAKILKIPILENHNLIEVDIPALVDKPTTIRGELHAKGEDEYNGEWVKKGNERGADIAKRMLLAFDEIKNQNKNVPLIVGHGDPLAFLLYALDNPGKNIISISEILKKDYGLEKGEAVILTIDEHDKITEKKLIKTI